MSTVTQIEEVAATNGHASPEPEIIEQPQRSKDTWLTGPSDLVEMDLEVPGLNDSVTIRSLSAGQFSEIVDRSAVTGPDGRPSVNMQMFNRLTFRYGLVEPKFSEEEVNVVAFRHGPAFSFVVEAITEISKSSPEAINRFRERFRAR